MRARPASGFTGLLAEILHLSRDRFSRRQRRRMLRPPSAPNWNASEQTCSRPNQRRFDEFEIGLFRDQRELRERLVGPENVRAAFSRRFEDHEEHHWPPIPHQCRHCDRNAAGWVGIKAWMRLDLNRETRFDLQVEK